MAIKMPGTKKVDTFVAAAPDANATGELMRKGVTRGNREQITHTMPPEMLARIDAQAKSRGMTRAAFINFSISLALDQLSS